jgi:glycosyltransferase involved in cell wall biosynthesis
VEKRWELEPTSKLYPPVNMYNPQSTAADKEKIILSVSRFEISGSKKQVELIQAYGEMCRKHPQETAGWKLVLVGGSTPGNTYMDTVFEAVEKANCDIEVKSNAAVSEIKDYYRRASIFWHACGLDETRPERVEHFGMTTVEAMQNCCVPIVIDGGGQREIVEHGRTGFRFSSLSELQKFSLDVMTDQPRCESMAILANERSHLFSQEVFKQHLETLLDDVECELLGRDMLPGAKKVVSA